MMPNMMSTEKYLTRSFVLSGLDQLMPIGRNVRSSAGASREPQVLLRQDDERLTKSGLTIRVSHSCFSPLQVC